MSFANGETPREEETGDYIRPRWYRVFGVAGLKPSVGEVTEDEHNDLWFQPRGGRKQRVDDMSLGTSD